MIRRLSAEPGVFIGTQSGECVQGSSAVWDSRGAYAQWSSLGCCRPQGQGVPAAASCTQQLEMPTWGPPGPAPRLQERRWSGKKSCQVLVHTIGGHGGAVGSRSYPCEANLLHFREPAKCQVIALGIQMWVRASLPPSVGTWMCEWNPLPFLVSSSSLAP